jgi:DNA-binding NarL/FixJ family response regulator
MEAVAPQELHLTSERHSATPAATMQRAMPDPAENRFDLTARELQIVQALAEGMSNKDLSSHFGLSEHTIKHHLTRIFDKVGAYNRLELVVLANHHGLAGHLAHAL